MQRTSGCLRVASVWRDTAQSRQVRCPRIVTPCSRQPDARVSSHCRRALRQDRRDRSGPMPRTMSCGHDTGVFFFFLPGDAVVMDNVVSATTRPSSRAAAGELFGCGLLVSAPCPLLASRRARRFRADALNLCPSGGRTSSPLLRSRFRRSHRLILRHAPTMRRGQGGRFPASVVNQGTFWHRACRQKDALYPAMVAIATDVQLCARVIRGSPSATR